MTIREQVHLSDYSTMRLGGIADYACDVTTRMEVIEALDWARTRNLPVQMIGGGSNIIWRDEGFHGLLIINRLQRFEIFDEDGENVYITAGAGELWDSVVERTVTAGLTGIEALSLIPGSTGATPIQNVGAYGQDISQTLTTIEAFDTQVGDYITIPAMDCGFGYRTSRFKTTDRGRFYITAITLHLRRGLPEPPFYSAINAFLTEHKITTVTPAVLRHTVIAIRSAKLPDPALIGNTGSFFANPIVSRRQYQDLLETYGAFPHWDAADGVKIAAAWLIEQAGYKDFHDAPTGMATWYAQPLVLVNEKANSTANLLAFKQQIVEAVRAKFGITLEQEPELLPNI